MTSKFLSDIGMGSFDLGYLVIIAGVSILLLLIAIILLIVQMVKVGKLNKRIDKLTSGREGKSLEKEINQLLDENKDLKEAVAADKKNIKHIFKVLEKTYQKKGIVKYDAFNQMGGQLSFSLALLDQNNDGFIINSVHSTEGCYSYTKEIQKGESELLLGKEEQEALNIALGE